MQHSELLAWSICLKKKISNLKHVHLYELSFIFLFCVWGIRWISKVENDKMDGRALMISCLWTLLVCWKKLCLIKLVKHTVNENKRRKNENLFLRTSTYFAGGGWERVFNCDGYQASVELLGLSTRNPGATGSPWWSDFSMQKALIVWAPNQTMVERKMLREPSVYQKFFVVSKLHYVVIGVRGFSGMKYLKSN